MTATGIAKYIGRSSRWVRRMTELGSVPSVRQKTKGGHYRYADTPDLRQWMEEMRRLPKWRRIPERFDSATARRRLTKIRQLAAKFDVAMDSFCSVVVDAVNLAFEAGLIIQARFGCKRLTRRKWKRYLEGQVSFDYPQAKLYLAVARLMSGPAKNFREALPAWQKMNELRRRD